MSILESLSVVVVGILVVFLGLTILIFCIQLTSSFFTKKRENQNDDSSTNDDEISSDSIEESEETVDEEIVAAITSAISVLLNKTNKNTFVVRHIKRISK